MKVYLDACAIDWLLDSPRSREFAALIRGRQMTAFVSGEVVAEIASTPSNGQQGERRLKLLGIALGGMLKLEPTWIPMIGGSAPIEIWSDTPPFHDLVYTSTA